MYRDGSFFTMSKSATRAHASRRSPDPEVGRTDRSGEGGLVFGGRGSGPAALVALEVRDAVAAGPTYLDEARADARHSGLGEKARVLTRRRCATSVVVRRMSA